MKFIGQICKTIHNYQIVNLKKTFVQWTLATNKQAQQIVNHYIFNYNHIKPCVCRVIKNSKFWNKLKKVVLSWFILSWTTSTKNCESQSIPTWNVSNRIILLKHNITGLNFWSIYVENFYHSSFWRGTTQIQ